MLLMANPYSYDLRQIERDEAQRQAFIEQLATVPESQRVYVDEAGMDNRDEYSYAWNGRGIAFRLSFYP